MRVIESEHELLLSPETAEDRAACSQIGCKTPFPWDGTARAWRIPRFAVPCLPECVSQLLPDYQTPIRPQPSFLSLLELPEKVQKALFPYQGPEVLKLTTGPYALWAAAGVGKTLMSLSAFYLLYKRGAVDGALVIGPEPGRHVWCGPDSDAQKWIGMPGEYLKTGAKECPEAPILYSTPAKIFRSPYMGWLADKVRTGRWVLIIDEAHTCFIGDTLVTTDIGDIPIKDVVEKGLGKLALSYCKGTDSLEWRPIVNRFKNPYGNLCRLTHESGSLVCTTTHQIHTEEEGYVDAASLTNQTLRTLPQRVHHQESRSQVLREILWRESAQEKTYTGFVRPLREVLHQTPREISVLLPPVLRRGLTSGRRQKMSRLPERVLHHLKRGQKMVLQGLLRPIRSGQGEGGFASGVHRPERILRKNAAAQSYERPRNTGENGGHFKVYGAQATCTRRERPASNSTPEAPLRLTGGRMATRVLCTHKRKKRERLPLPLQTGLSLPKTEAVCRNRRPQPSLPESEAKGPKENRKAQFSRVVRVTPLESSRSEHPFVYDIEVAGNHNYFANGVLVSNCAGHLTHRFSVLERWSRYCRYIWPLSATPVRNWPDSFWALYRLLTQHELPYATWVEWLQASRHRNSRFWHEDRLEAVSTHLDHCSSTITKAEAAPWLPPVTEHLVKVPMRGRQKELYAALVGTGRMQLEEAGGVSRTVVAKQLLHSLASMASIASHPIVAGEVGAPDKSIAKLEQLDFILSSHYGEKACIWSWHPAVLDWLHKLLWGKAVRYHGQVSPSEKDEAVRRFNNDPKCRYFLGNPSAAGTSLNLGAGTVRVYWDLSWSWHEYHQSGERINRVTRTLPITSYTMVSEDSIEELMWRSIGQKMEMASLLMGRGSDDPIFVHNQAKEILSLWKK